MKKLIAIALLTVSLTAAASCPMGTVYRCYQGVNGKMICGCF